MSNNNFYQKDYIRKDKVYVFVVFAFIVGFLSSLIFIKVTSTNPQAEHKHESHDHGKTNQNMMGENDKMNNIDELEKKAQENPNNANLWTELGNSYFDNSQFNKAIDAYNKSLAINPNNPDVLTDLGVMYRRSKQPLKAIESFNKAMKTDPNHIISRMNKGIVYLYDLQDKKSAIQAWEDALRINPNLKNSHGEPISLLVDKLKQEIQ